MNRTFYYSTNMRDIYRVRDTLISKGYVNRFDDIQLQYIKTITYKVIWVDPRDNTIDYTGLSRIDLLQIKEEYGVFDKVNVGRIGKIKKLLL